MDTETLRRGQQQNYFFGKVRSHHLLHREVNTDLEEKLDSKSSLLHNRDLVWYTLMGRGEPMLAIHRALASDLGSLVHVMLGHPGVDSTLALLRERLNWLALTRDAQEYVSSCGCRRRKR